MEVNNSEISKPKLVHEENRLTHQAEETPSGVLEQERKTSEPKISVHVFLSPHGTKKDIEGFERAFREADVFIPERSGWTKDTLRIFRELSEGKLRPEDVGGEGGSEELEKELDRVIYDSHKPITFVDLPEGHALDTEGDSLKFPSLQFGPGFFEQNLTGIKNYFKKLADLQKEREWFMLSQIRPKIQELLDEYPSLRDKKEIRVAMILGSVHASFLDLLNTKGFKATKEFSRSSFAFVSAFHVELGKKYASGEPVGDDLVARTAFELCFARAFRKNLTILSRDSCKIDATIRKIASQFSREEIKNMFESASNFDEFVKVFVPKMRAKGFEIPRSESEMDKLLAIHKGNNLN